MDRSTLAMFQWNLLLSLYPPTSGISGLRIKVGNTDVSGEELIPLPTQNVTGRIIAKKGPVPYRLSGI
jgi:hypothetical protein